MPRMRRYAPVIGTISLLCLFTAMTGAASAAPAGGVKGDPQPEMTPFKIGASESAGSVAVESNGSIVVTYDIGVGNGKTVVCVLGRGGRKCSHKVILTPPGAPDEFGTPQVFAPSPGHVVVLQNTTEFDYLYTSTNGGVSFGAPVQVGTLSVGAAALIGSDIVFGAGDDGSGAQAESVAITASGPPGSTATATTAAATDFGVGSYKGGALIASDYDGSKYYTTYVAYARSGTNFNASGSYHNVAKIGREQLIGISGDALLTMQGTGKNALELRLFNGKGFGPAHVVPGTSGGGPEWFTLDQDPSGRVHVFNESTHYPRIYNLYEVSTSTGAHWSGAVDLGDAIQSNEFAAALDARGSGLVLGTSPAWGYPVLATQSVSFKLKASTIARGHHTTGSGKGSPAGHGREVALQVERSGRWYTVATTHESSSGSFSFTIKGSAAGHYNYRAVASDLAGYLQFGYSAVRSLHVR
jgi:hypothetical protein